MLSFAIFAIVLGLAAGVIVYAIRRDHRVFAFLVLLWFFAFVLAGVVWLVAASFSPAAAQGINCAPWPVLRDHLAGNCQETPAGVGIVSDQAIAQLLTSADGATFSVVIIRADGLACLIASGTAWEATPTPDGRAGSF